MVGSCPGAWRDRRKPSPYRPRGRPGLPTGAHRLQFPGTPAPASAVGPMLSLRHDWGGASSDGLGALAAATRFNSRTESDAGQKLLTAEAVWGIALPKAGLINSPYVGFEGTDSARDYTLGWRMTHASSTSDLSLGVSATRREMQGKVADHLFGVELNSRW